MSELKESASLDRQLRDTARYVVRDIEKRAQDELGHGAIEFHDESGKMVSPFGYAATMFPDLVVGLVCNLPKPMLIDFKQYPSSVSNEIRYCIGYPYGLCPVELRQKSLDEVSKFSYRYVPKNLELLGQILSHSEEHFVHEFIHYADVSRAKTELDGTNGLTPANYYNSPLEVNAYFNQAVSKLDAHPAEWWQRPYETVLRDLIGELDPQFVSVIRQGNQRRIIRRFYDMWQSHQISG